MTPAQMFKQFGDGTRVSFTKGDIVETPSGPANFEYEFTRGLRWWCKTSAGTFMSKTLAALNCIQSV